MPATMLGTHDLGTALAAYRMCLSLSLARGSGPFAPLPDPVLAGFPHLLADHHVLAEFLTKWRDITTKMTAILDVGVGDGGRAGTDGGRGRCILRADGLEDGCIWRRQKAVREKEGQGCVASRARGWNRCRSRVAVFHGTRWSA